MDLMTLVFEVVTEVQGQRMDHLHHLYSVKRMDHLIFNQVAAAYHPTQKKKARAAKLVIVIELVNSRRSQRMGLL